MEPDSLMQSDIKFSVRYVHSTWRCSHAFGRCDNNTEPSSKKLPAAMRTYDGGGGNNANYVYLAQIWNGSLRAHRKSTKSEKRQLENEDRQFNVFSCVRFQQHCLVDSCGYWRYWMTDRKSFYFLSSSLLQSGALNMYSFFQVLDCYRVATDEWCCPKKIDSFLFSRRNEKEKLKQIYYTLKMIHGRFYSENLRALRNDGWSSTAVVFDTMNDIAGKVKASPRRMRRFHLAKNIDWLRLFSSAASMQGRTMTISW